MSNHSYRLISSVDVARTFAICGVIWLHSSALTRIPQVYMQKVPLLYTNIILMFCRLAVPFFFIVSGYFFGRTLSKGIKLEPLFMKYTKRLLSIFAAWYLFHFLADFKLFPETQLWFLIALWLAFVLISALIFLNLENLIMPVSILLYFISVIYGVYHQTIRF